MRDTIVIGASAGGVEALRALMAQLPRDLPASVLVVLHSASFAENLLPNILGRSTSLPVVSPERTERLAPGRVYVARPDRHLAVRDGEVIPTRGPRVNRSRPAIDVLFRSSARERAQRVIAVILTGFLDDGVNALLELRSRGGIGVVQDPADAEYPDLPRNAIAGAGADHVVRLAEMGPLLVRLVKESGTGGGSMARGNGGLGAPDGQGGGMSARSRGPAQEWSSSAEASPEGGQPSVFSCPECHGVLAKTGPDDLPRFACRVGHAYDPETLLSEQGDQAEKAIWTAIRSTEELLSLTRKLEMRARSLGDKAKEETLARKAAGTERHAKALRALVEPERPPA